MHADCGMTARLPQVVPIFCHIDAKVSLRPEDFCRDITARALQGNIFSRRVRINAPAAMRALNIASNKPALETTLSHKPEAISIPGNSHRSPWKRFWRVRHVLALNELPHRSSPFPLRSEILLFQVIRFLRPEGTIVTDFP